MKLAVVFLLVSCVSFVYGACPECDGLSEYYDLVGCKVLCKRGKCVTTYSCRKILILLRSKKQCYLNGKYYNVNDKLPGTYPAPNGIGKCEYICIFTSGFYAFVPANCQPTNQPPTPAQCIDLFKISGPFILQIQGGVLFRPNLCSIQLLPAPPQLPASNCGFLKSKCCAFGGNFYKIGTVINAFGFKCMCMCPPLMSCM
ncbi:hypothetical protein RN001_013220 [Aquatica leii]|uniref:Uncharacterized protein n=1 Tax=Aquatica leii TaxID=1421715 RepID=A0AAN7PZQ0_9COLE|nr:hypothetical protein RN001_013220 [Aquatica leii]